MKFLPGKCGISSFSLLKFAQEDFFLILIDSSLFEKILFLDKTFLGLIIEMAECDFSLPSIKSSILLSLLS